MTKPPQRRVSASVPYVQPWANYSEFVHLQAKNPELGPPIGLRSLGVKGSDLVQACAHKDHGISEAARTYLDHRKFVPQCRGTLNPIVFVRALDMMTFGFGIHVGIGLHDLPDIIGKYNGYSAPTLDVVVPLASAIDEGDMDCMMAFEIIVPSVRLHPFDRMEPMISIHRLSPTVPYRIDAHWRPKTAILGPGTLLAIVKSGGETVK
ncbi:MAG: hypothetical protein KGI59_01780 [Patescibacteria group bacterium]|nr:hypothetical protein [Patescibacteria group bacterium]